MIDIDEEYEEYEENEEYEELEKGQVYISHLEGTTYIPNYSLKSGSPIVFLGTNDLDDEDAIFLDYEGEKWHFENDPDDFDVLDSSLIDSAVEAFKYNKKVRIFEKCLHYISLIGISLYFIFLVIMDKMYPLDSPGSLSIDIGFIIVAILLPICFWSGPISTILYKRLPVDTRSLCYALREKKKEKWSEEVEQIQIIKEKVREVTKND